MATQYPLRLKTISCLNSKPPPQPSPRYQNPPATPPALPPLLSVAKPSWIIRTESNVRKEQRKKPEAVCIVCKGSGRVDCFNCAGKVFQTVYFILLLLTSRTHLRKDELYASSYAAQRRMAKMVRCRDCRGSGLSYCSRCLGTGEYRYIMGFQFMKKDCDDQ